MKTTTLFIYLDGCQHDYISKKNTPFLYELGQKGTGRKVRTTAGFTQRTPMLTGTYPSTSGHFTWYLFDPSNSPFKWIRPFGFSKTILSYSPLIKRAIRMVTKIATSTYYPDPAHIPLDLLPYFDVSINKFRLEKELSHLPNIFSVCDERGLKYFNAMETFATVGSKPYTHFFRTAEKTLKADQLCNIYLTHLGDLDILGHKHGPGSKEVNTRLKEIDEEIEHFCYLLSRRYSNYNILVASDHGMRKITGSVPLLEQLTDIELRVPRDYLYFLDATLARFWFKDERSKERIQAILSNIHHGHMLTEQEKLEKHINFKNNKYGDTLFWLDSGWVSCPSFFQKTLRGTKGVHGYLDDEQMLGTFIVYSSKEEIEGTERDVVELVDTFPTLLSLLGISKVPCEGTSVIRRNDT